MPATARAASSLHAAILAHPTDDAARLAYADYLEDHNKPERAEFIRAQVELARLPVWDRRAKLYRLRARLLLIEHGEEWRAELPQFSGVAWGRFERGFVTEVTVEDVRVLAKRVDAIRAASPVTGIELGSLEGISSRGIKPGQWLSSLRLGAGCAAADGVACVLDSPLATHLTRLVCTGALATTDAARHIAAATDLTGLREIDLSHGKVGDAGAVALAQAKHLAGLRVLRLSAAAITGSADDHLSATSMRALAASPSLASLTTLVLANQHLGDDGARAILSSTTLTKLEHLSFAGTALTARAFSGPATRLRLQNVDLSQCVIADVAAAAMAVLPQFSEVCRFNLRSCDLGVKGLAAIVKSPLPGSLCELDLAENPLRNHGLDALAAARWPELHTLNLANCGLGPEAIKPLAAASGIKRLLDLDLSGNEVGAGGAIAITKAGWANSLVRLNLARCRCAAGAVLAASPRLRDIQQLDLSDNPLNAAGVSALMEAEWRELSDLRLSGTNAGDAGLQAVARSPALPRLVTLTMARCGLSTAGLESLLAALGGGRASKVEEPGGQLIQLDLSQNLELGDEAVRLLGRAELRALRFVALNYLGLTETGLQQLRDGPLHARLLRLEYFGNTPPLDKRAEEVARPPEFVVRPPASPDWEATGFPVAGP